ncbi:MAG: hypothetical protein GVY22_05835 [Gammaproteobacteria bacterium]|nr:hypothetical protein [Gammaproteobacteria bacterium]
MSRERHRDRRWQHYRNYEFARGFTLCSLVLAEIDEATLSLPYGFIQRRDMLIPVAILGPPKGECLYVGGQGTWIGGYVPAILRGYPFRLIKTTDDRLVLHVDEGSGLIVGAEDDGEPFFEGGEPSSAIQDVKTYLENLEASRRQTAEACKLLQKFNLVQEWAVESQHGSEQQTYPAPMKGLLRIDPAALERIDPQAFEELNRAGALRLSMYQTLSERHLAAHKALEKAHQKRQQAQDSREDVRAEDYFDSDGPLSFAWED